MVGDLRAGWPAPLFSKGESMELVLFLIFICMVLRRAPENGNDALKACVMRFVCWLLK